MNLWNSPEVKMTDKVELVSNLDALEVRPFIEITRLFILHMIMDLYWTGHNP
jgi:hypothetical protein